LLTTSATIFGAPVGVPLVANGVDNFQAGLRKLFTGEDANTLLYDATKRLTGSDKLAGTVDAATGFVLNAAASAAAANSLKAGKFGSYRGRKYIPAPATAAEEIIVKEWLANRSKILGLSEADKVLLENQIEHIGRKGAKEY
jgi:hypothetical protein